MNNATIIYREELTPELAIIRVAPDSGEVPPFEPGQYAELALPELDERPEEERRKLERRAYSIASSPASREYVEFFIVLVPNGSVTPKLFSLPVGARVWLGPKIKGKFTLEDIPEGKDLLMISTGTGLAPFVSMAREYLADRRFRSFIVMHGTRRESDLAYREQLMEMAAQSNKKLIYVPALTREPEDSSWAGLRGRVPLFLKPGTFEEITGKPFSPETLQIFLCGNPDMIDQLIEQLTGYGFKIHNKKDPGNIHFERYW